MPPPSNSTTVEKFVACKATSLGYSRGATSYPPGAPVSVPEYVIAYEEEHHKAAPRIVRLTGAELKTMDEAEEAALREQAAAAATIATVPTPGAIFDSPPEPAFNMDGRVSVPEPAPPTPEAEAAPPKRGRSTS